MKMVTASRITIILLLLIYMPTIPFTVAQICTWDFKIKKQPQTTLLDIANTVAIADSELLVKIKTVTDKQHLPPSGDMHDYMSQGRYWWPNPEKPDGLPYIQRDGVTNPEIEKFDRIPLGYLSTSIKNLGLAYTVTSEEKYAIKAVDNLRKWFINEDTKMNPNLNYAQTLPGKNISVPRKSGVIEGYLFVEMLDGVDLLSKSPNFTERDHASMKKWFAELLEWLMTAPSALKEKKSKNNHGTSYDLQVARYALFSGNIELAKQTINEVPINRLKKQILADGAQPHELKRPIAFFYPIYNLTILLELCLVAEKLNINLLERTTEKNNKGVSILLAADFMVPFVGIRQEDYPHLKRTESNYDELMQDLCWVLHRIDYMLNVPRYRGSYLKFLKQNKEILV